MAKHGFIADDDGSCDILIVRSESKDYAVAAPAYMASVGQLVEFRVAERMTLVGQVTYLMHCQQFDDAWGCIAAFTRIHDVVAIYKAIWNEEIANT